DGDGMKRAWFACAALLLVSSLARADGDAARGAQRFEEGAPCHALGKDKETVGPSLYGVFGRKAGAGSEFRYSPALKRSGIAWDESSIDRYIADPQGFI